MGLKLTFFAVVLLPQLTGCALTGRRGPAPAAVAAARDTSLQGMAAMEAGDWNRAESLLRQAAAASPTDADSRRYLAEALWRRGAIDDALTEINTAVSLDSSDAMLVVRAGEMLLATRSTEPALARANQAIRLDSKLPAAWTLRGHVYWQMNQTDRALADLHRALEYSPNNREILLDVAALYRQTSQPARSLTILQHLLDTYPKGEEPQQTLLLEGVTLKELGRPQQAAESLLAASRHGPPSVEILFQLAQIQASLGDYPSATAAAEQALAIDASHGPTRELLMQLAARAAPVGPQLR